MPIHKEFHGMLDGMTEQYCTGEDKDTTKTETAEGYPGKTCRKALGVFYATCKEKGLDYTKPMSRERVREHVAAILPFTILEKIVDKPLKIRGLAITAGMSRNLNIYTPEELQAFAGKLVAAPVYVEHVAVPNAVGKVIKTEWDGSNLFYEAEIYDDEVAAQIRKGLIQHVSVGADYETIDILDGQVPHGLHNAELSLVAVPGIPETNVQVLEKLAPTGTSGVVQMPLKERGNMKKKQKVKEQNQGQGEPKTDKERFMAHFGIDEEAFQKLYDILGDELFKLLPERGQKTKEQDGEIKPGEDESKEDFIQRCKVAGNDEPQCQVIWDKAHPGSSTAEQLEDSQITSDVCGVEPSDQEQLQAKVTELLARVDKLEKCLVEGNVAESLLKKAKEKIISVKEAIKILENLLPSPMVERSSMGMQRECQAIRGAVLQLREMLKSE